MRKNKGSEHRQGYNAQAAVSTDGSQLVWGSRVGTCAADRGELIADVEAVPEALRRVPWCRPTAGLPTANRWMT